MGAHFVLEVIDLINQVLLLLLLLVFVVVDTLLEGQLWLLEPGERVRITLHESVEARITKV